MEVNENEYCDDREVYYDDRVPLDIKRQIITHCSPSTTDALRSVSRSWFKAINKNTFIIRNRNIDYSELSSLAQYSTSLSIEIVHPPADLRRQGIIEPIANYLSNQLISLKLGKQSSPLYDWNEFSPLTSLTNLTELDLNLNQIELVFISHLPSLKKLHIQISKAAANTEDPLSSTVLEDLALDTCSASLLGLITNPSRLTKLYLNGNFLKEEIQQFTNVKALSLVSNNDEEDGTVDINAFPFLESLHLENSRFTCNFLTLTHLTKLDIREEPDFVNLSDICCLTNLRVLTLRSNMEYNENPPIECFSKLTKLEELNLSNIYDNSGLFQRENMDYLEYLNCPNLTKMLVKISSNEGDHLKHLTKLSPSLLHLELQLWCETEHISAISSLTNLTHLVASFSSNEDFLKCQLSTKLKKLTLVAGFSNVNFNLKLPNLEKLSISGIEFSDEDAQYLSSTLQQLTFRSHKQPITASFAHLTKVTCLKVKNMVPEDFENIIQLVNLKKLISQSQWMPDQLSQLTSLQCYISKTY